MERGNQGRRGRGTQRGIERERNREVEVENTWKMRGRERKGEGEGEVDRKQDGGKVMRGEREKRNGMRDL